MYSKTCTETVSFESRPLPSQCYNTHMSNRLKIILCIVALIAGLLILTKAIVGRSGLGPVVPQATTTLPFEGLVYENSQYGFSFSLPATWRGYTIVENTWAGMSLGATDGQNYTSEIGPLILIRHPLWTEKNPRQDIPIMVFTLNQWTNMQNDAFHIGAAPINPSELGRNDNYVFALPARYNFAYHTGFEEVDRLIQSGALKSF